MPTTSSSSSSSSPTRVLEVSEYFNPDTDTNEFRYSFKNQEPADASGELTALEQAIRRDVASYRSPVLIAALANTVNHRTCGAAYMLHNERQHNAAHLARRVHLADHAHPLLTCGDPAETLAALSNQETGSLSEAILSDALGGRTVNDGGLLRGAFNTSATATKSDYTHSDLVVGGVPVDLKSTAKGPSGAPFVQVNKAEAARAKYALLLISHTFTDDTGTSITLYYLVANPATCVGGFWKEMDGVSPYYRLDISRLTAGWRSHLLLPKQATSGKGHRPWCPRG